VDIFYYKTYFCNTWLHNKCPTFSQGDKLEKPVHGKTPKPVKMAELSINKLLKIILDICEIFDKVELDK